MKPDKTASQDDQYDVVVLGCGISGMIAASRLLAEGFAKVLVLDNYTNPGGNHIDVHISGFTFDIGSFIFHENSSFFEEFPSLVKLYLAQKATIGKINPRGKISRYPFDVKNDLILNGPLSVIMAAASLIYSRVKVDPTKNAGQFVQYWIGSKLSESTGLLRYLGRFYGVHPNLIEGAFATKRMRWVSDNARILRKFRPQRKPKPSRTLIRPYSGFMTVYSEVLKNLEERGASIKLGVSYERISRSGEQSCVEFNGRLVHAPVILSTIPLVELSKLCEMPICNELRSVDLVSLFYSFEGVRKFPHSIFYNFSDDGEWKRITMHSDFYGDVRGRQYFSVEIVWSQSRVEPNIGELDQAFRQHVSEEGLFTGDLNLEGFRKTSFAYPVYVAGSTRAAEDALKAFQTLGIISFGRQGGFDYQPTAGVSATTATRVVRALKEATIE